MNTQRRSNAIKGDPVQALMFFPRTLAAVLLLVEATAALGSDVPTEIADSVYRNATIYTVNAVAPWAEAVAVRAGKIVAVGSEEDIAGFTGDGTVVVDLEGKFVLPGFHDSHVHPIHGGLKTRGLFVHPDRSAGEVAAIIAEYADSHPQEKIIVARGFGMQVQAHRSVLDAVVPDRPVFVEGFGGHSLWLNSKALALAGIDRDTPTPQGGAIIRDETDGEATGLLFDTATYLALDVMPDAKPTLAEKTEIGRRVVATMSSYGVTSFKDAIVDEDILRVYGTLEQEGSLHQRVAAAILVSGFGLTPEQEAKARALVGQRARFSSRLVNPDFVKIFMDGVPPAIALLDPDAGLPDPMTEPLIPASGFVSMLGDYDAQGIGVMAHAHGDAAIRAVLDAVAAVRATRSGTGAVHQIAHCSMIHPDDAARLRALGVVCEMSPYIWFPSPIMDAAQGILGTALMRRSYPAGTVVGAGAVFAAGSDWAYDNLDLNPLPYLEALVSRQDPFARTPGRFNPEQAISLAQAIRAFTLNGAFATGSTATSGSIEVGKWADFVVLDQNLFEIPVEDISEVKVRSTVFDGRVVYRSTSAAD